MRANPNTRGVNDNWNESVKVLRLDVDQDKARALGVTSQAIAQASRTMLSRHDGRPVPRERPADRHRAAPAARRARRASSVLGNAYLPTAVGHARCRCRRCAHAEFVWEPGVMWRENRDYAITVQGDIVEGMQGADRDRRSSTPKLRRAARQAAGRLPHRGGRRGGRERARARPRSSANVPLVLFIVFTLLMLQLHSFCARCWCSSPGRWASPARRWRCCCCDRPFGFVAQLGVIALFGMIHAQLGDPGRPDRAGHRAPACRPGTRSSNRRCGAAARSC